MNEIESLGNSLKFKYRAGNLMFIQFKDYCKIILYVF